MPVVIFSNPNFPNQVGPNGTQAYVQQLNFRMMLNEVCQWNPDLDPMIAGRFLNNAYRKIVDMRDWYALKVRGQIAIPNTISSGQCIVTNGSNIVQGIGTTWTNALIGRQFRSSFASPWQTIFNVNAITQQLTIDMPFAGATATTGYQLAQVYVTMGANFRRIAWSVNQVQGWPMRVDTTVAALNVWDPWRQSLGWSSDFAVRAPTPDGQYQIEIWPTAFSLQTFPFEGYIQPPDMQLDSDSPASFIRSDILVTWAVAQAKLFSGRGSKYYDPTVAAAKMKEFDAAVENMVYADNYRDQTDVTFEDGYQEGATAGGPGNFYAFSHDV